MSSSLFLFHAFYKSDVREIWPALYHNIAEGLFSFQLSLHVCRQDYIFPLSKICCPCAVVGPRGFLQFFVSGIILSSQTFISGTRQVIWGQRWFRLVWWIWRHAVSKICFRPCSTDVCTQRSPVPDGQHLRYSSCGMNWTKIIGTPYSFYIAVIFFRCFVTVEDWK
jgi:hypothetical protein